MNRLLRSFALGLHVWEQDDVANINFKSLYFQEYYAPSGYRKNMYNFLHYANESGLFYFKEAHSNKIIASGSTKSCLYTELQKRISFYGIDPQKTRLAIIRAPAELIPLLREQIAKTYKEILLDEAYYQLMRYVEKDEHVPLRLIKFADVFHNVPRTRRHKTRVFTTTTYLKDRPGLYFIKEKKSKHGKSRLVYIGESLDLSVRITAHFTWVPPEIEHRANYYKTRHKYQYEVGVIEFPWQGMTRTELKHYLKEVERRLIAQFNPRDNRLKGKEKEIQELLEKIQYVAPLEIEDPF